VHVLFVFGLWNQCSGVHTVTVLAGYLEDLQQEARLLWFHVVVRTPQSQ
jgi:hypothetical protein